MITRRNGMELADLPNVAQAPWYAIRTKSHCEVMAARSLENRGYEQYLPLYRKGRRRFQRVIETEVPLFPGYLFCRLDPSIPFRIVMTPGVVAIVGFGTNPMPIGDAEIEAVKRVLCSGLAAAPCPFLLEGQRIRVVCGALSGLEGILLKKKNELRMLVSVAVLQRSVSVEIDREYIASI
jgi:transcription antitermination factor NusG